MQYRLIDIIEEFECKFRARMSRLSAHNHVHITSFQTKALLFVERNVGCSQQIIADLLFRNKAQVARTVKELELQNLVYKTTARPGGRIFQLHLTSEGKSVCNQIKQFRRIIMEDMLHSMNRDDEESLTVLLTHLVKNLEDSPVQRDTHELSDGCGFISNPL